MRNVWVIASSNFVGLFELGQPVSQSVSQSVGHSVSEWLGMPHVPA